jgi:hypothetical protein
MLCVIVRLGRFVRQTGGFDLQERARSVGVVLMDEKPGRADDVIEPADAAPSERS